MRPLYLLLSTFIFAIGCSSGDSDGDGNGSVEQTGNSCTSADQCYPDVAEASTLKGEAQCLDRVEGGYCTHLCQTDTDCCAVPGECRTNYAQVCSPFESTGKMMCFLSCERADVEAEKDGDGDADGFCARQAARGFKCRSSGGGSKNRKVCTP